MYNLHHNHMLILAMLATKGRALWV